MINPFYDIERKLDKLLRLRLPIPPFIINLLLAEWCKAHQKLTDLEWQRLHSTDTDQVAALDTQIKPVQQSCRQIGQWLRQAGTRKVETSTRRYAATRPEAATYYHLANLFEKHLGHKPIIREFLHQAIALDPEHIQAHWLLAKVLYRQWRGDWTQALPHFQKVLSVFPQDPEANRAVAKILVEEKDYEAAHEYYEQAVALNSEDVSVHEEYADLLWTHLQDMESAAPHFLRAFTLSRGHKRLRERLQALRKEATLSQSLRQQIDTALTAFTRPAAPPRPSKAEQIIQRYAQWVAQNQKLLDLIRQRLQLIGTDAQWDVQAQIDQHQLQLGKTGRGLKGLVGVLPNKLKERVLPELEANPTADGYYHLASFLRRYYAFDGSQIGGLCRQALELESEHIFAHWLLGRISERAADRNATARKYYEAAVTVNPDYFEAYLLLAGLPYAFEGEETAQENYREQALARLQYRRQGTMTLESAQDDLGAACNAFFLPEQRVQIASIQMTYAGIIGGIVAQTILLDTEREEIAGDLVDSLVKQLLDQPHIQNVLVSYPRVYWEVDVIKKLLGLMIKTIEYTLQATHPNGTVTQEMVDKIGHQLTAALRKRARLFRSNVDQRGWFKEWWRQSKIDRYYQYYEIGSWKGLMGGRFVTSSKHPDDWEEPW